MIGKAKEIWKKHEEGINYLFWGGVAFFLSMFLFGLFANVFGLYEQIANVITWIICVMFTYLTNRSFVFKSKSRGLSGMGREFASFVSARLMTLLVENALLFLLIDLMALHNMLAKLIGQFVVIVSNYFLSKLWIFKNRQV